MTITEFKDRYPHLAHLKGNDLWDAMEASMLLDARCAIHNKLPGDDEIVHTEQIEEFTFSYTRGAMRVFEEMDKGTRPISEVLTSYRMVFLD